MDWQRFYQSYPTGFADDDYLSQAGHTIGGAPISTLQFDALLERMTSILELRPTDSVLDLCCGNGVFTRELARRSKRVVGLDFSVPLIDAAERAHPADNLTYVLHDVKRLHEAAIDRPFDKVVMCGALQHFERGELEPLIRAAVAATNPTGAIAFMLVPDRARRWDFYRTPAARAKHLGRRALRRERMGTWWPRRWIVDTCTQLSLDAEFFDLDPRLHPTRYRFDVRMTRQ